MNEMTFMVDGGKKTQKVESDSPLQTTAAKPSAGSNSSVTATVASSTVLAENASRLGATIYNEGASTCYISLTSVATTTSYTLQVASGGYFECPFWYTGIISGITASGTAVLRITEVT